MLRRDFLALTPLPALLGVSSPAAAQRAAAPADRRFEAIAALVREKMRVYRVPGVGLGVTVDGTTTLRGFRDEPRRSAPDHGRHALHHRLDLEDHDRDGGDAARRTGHA